MKKLYLLLAALLLSANANAVDLVGGLNQVSAAADNAAQTVEKAKTADATAKADTKKAIEAKKAEAKKAVAAKKAELEKAAAAKRAENEAKKAEQQKAVDDAKKSINNLKGAFGK